jgi:inner membrane protein
MATLLTHPLIAVVALPWFKAQRRSKTILLFGLLLTILPDADVIGFRYGIPYEHWLGHRGLSHSLFFAALLAIVLSQSTAKWLGASRRSLSIFYFLCLASHGVLDALTNGGLGVAFFAPFNNQRYFFPFQPVDVATLSIKHFFTTEGLSVLKSELLYIWLPGLVLLSIRTVMAKASARLRPLRDEKP